MKMKEILGHKIAMLSELSANTHIVVVPSIGEGTLLVTIFIHMNIDSDILTLVDVYYESKTNEKHTHTHTHILIYLPEIDGRKEVA